MFFSCVEYILISSMYEVMIMYVFLLISYIGNKRLLFFWYKHTTKHTKSAHIERYAQIKTY